MRGEESETAVVRLVGVTVRRGDRRLVDDVTWEVRRGEHWAVIGPNGCGKTTLLRVAGMRLHPTAGTVALFGAELGAVDVRTLRRRVGWVSANLADELRPALSAAEVVMTGQHGALEPWWHRYSDDDRARARSALAGVGMAAFAARPFGELSSGERQRVLLARALAHDPAIVLLDEPMAGLDYTGRAAVLEGLEKATADPAAPPTVLVTHHLEEIPRGATHALVMAEGRVLTAGRLAEAVTDAALSRSFGLPLRVEHDRGRWRAALDDH